MKHLLPIQRAKGHGKIALQQYCHLVINLLTPRRKLGNCILPLRIAVLEYSADLVYCGLHPEASGSQQRYGIVLHVKLLCRSNERQ